MRLDQTPVCLRAIDVHSFWRVIPSEEGYMYNIDTWIIHVRNTTGCGGLYGRRFTGDIRSGMSGSWLWVYRGTGGLVRMYYVGLTPETGDEKRAGAGVSSDRPMLPRLSISRPHNIRYVRFFFLLLWTNPILSSIPLLPPNNPISFSSTPQTTPLLPPTILFPLVTPVCGL